MNTATAVLQDGAAEPDRRPHDSTDIPSSAPSARSAAQTVTMQGRRAVLARLRSPLLSFLLLVALVAAWQWVTRPGATSEPLATTVTAEQIEYQQLMGKLPLDLDPQVEAGRAHATVQRRNGFPTPMEFARDSSLQLAHPFRDDGPNDKGIGIQLAHSLARVLAGFGLAMVLAIPLGLAIGMSPLLHRALNPFIQVLRPISPLAWMPIALYTIRDSSTSAIFVIFICAIWPMLLNTAHGVAGVRREWLDVARTLELSRWRTAWQVIVPAAAPTIVAGMRISMGIAWLVIVAAEMLVGGTGIGYFLWNGWNNLSLSSVLLAVLVIGLVGMALDHAIGLLQKQVRYAD